MGSLTWGMRISKIGMDDIGTCSFLDPAHVGRKCTAGAALQVGFPLQVW